MRALKKNYGNRFGRGVANIKEERMSTVINNAETNLWINVIIQAIKDAECEGPALIAIRNDAKQFLLGVTSSLYRVCKLCNLNYTAIVNTVKNKGFKVLKEELEAHAI